jgi:hypothetical protein
MFFWDLKRYIVDTREHFFLYIYFFATTFSRWFMLANFANLCQTSTIKQNWTILAFHRTIFCLVLLDCESLSPDSIAAFTCKVHANVFNLLPGKVVEYDKPTKLIETEGSLFRELVKEYWSYTSNGNI